MVRSVTFKAEMKSSWALMYTFMSITSPIKCKPIGQILCPCDETTWISRAEEFSCQEDLVYTCILNDEEELMEMCIKPYTVESDIGGCPFLERERENLGTTEIHFNECPGHGCPAENHEPYSISEIYKYKKCMVPKDKRKTELWNENTICRTLLNDPASYVVAFDVVLSTFSNNESDWMNTTTQEVPRERTEGYILFLLWLSGIMMLLLPMLATLLFYKIKEKLQEKYECCRGKDSKKKKKAKKKKIEAKAKKKAESSKKLLK